jgi:protein GON7
MSLPNAEYITPDTTKTFTLENIDKQKLSSNGTTTGPSLYLLESTNGGYVDKDKPAPLNLESPMSVLRGYVTQLQDDINIYLTDRIKSSGNAVEDAEDVQDDTEEMDTE